MLAWWLTDREGRDMFGKLMIRWELANPVTRWAIEGAALLVAVGVLLYAVGGRG